MKRFKSRIIVIVIALTVCMTTAFTGISPMASNKTASASSIEDQINRTDLEGLTEIDDDVTEYKITSDLGLDNFSRLVRWGIDFAGKTVFLASDINYGEKYPDNSKKTERGAINHAPIGTNQNPFRGNFDGCGYTVKIIEFAAGENQPVGFFGKTEGSMIKNLVIDNTDLDDKEVLKTGYQYLGGIVGHAIGTMIVNCVNKANLENTNAIGLAGGIIGYGEGFNVMNCLNLGAIKSANKVGHIVASYTTGSLLGCLNIIEATIVGNQADEQNLYSTNEVSFGAVQVWDDYDAPQTVKRFQNFSLTDWEAENKEDFLIELNKGVRASRIECARQAKDTNAPYSTRYRRHMLFWGLDEDGLPTPHTDNPVLKDELLFEYTHKQSGALALFRSYKDCIDYVTGDDVLSVQTREKFYKEYSLLTQKLNDMYIGIEFEIDNDSKVTDTNILDENEISFANRVAQFANLECLDKLNPIYNDWQDRMDEIFVTSLNDFAIYMVSSWYNDCVAFVLGDNDKATTTKQDLKDKYDELEAELYAMTFDGDSGAYTEAVTEFITLSINELDHIYYKWHVVYVLEEFEASFKNTKDSISKASVRTRVEQIYNEALAEINGTQEFSEGNWIDLAEIVDALTFGAINDITKAHNDWNKERERIKIIGIISVSAGILVIAVTALFIIMKRRENTYKTIIFGSDRLTRKEKRLEAKTNAISEQVRHERERKESFAEAQRLKAEVLIKLKQEQDEMQEVLKRKEAELTQKNLQVQKTAEMLAMMELRKQANGNKDQVATEQKEPESEESPTEPN